VRAPPPSRADGGGDTRAASYPNTVIRELRAQRRRETVTEGGWAELPDELLAKVLELLQAGGRGGLGFSQASATVRLVCAGWKAVYDALVTRLVLRQQTTDEAVGMLVLRFSAGCHWSTRRRMARVDGRGAASSGEQQPARAHLSRPAQLLQGDGSWRAGAPQLNRSPKSW
jgi:hypothetical protein